MTTGILRAGSKDNSNRKYRGGGPRPDNMAHKRAEAKERAEAWQKLTPVQQLKALDARFGAGKGATKQRAKIQKLIEGPKKMTATSDEMNVVATATSTKIRAKDRRAAEQAKRPSR